MHHVKPTVSVIVPCFNAAHFLHESIGSALAQTYPPLEVIVVDDGSTDESAAVAAAMGPAVRVLRQDNRGESAARNRAIDAARAEWLAFLDADDVWRPTKLERQLAAAGDGIAGIHTSYFRFGDDTRVIDHSTTPLEVLHSVEYLAAATPIMISSLMVRRDLPIRFPEWTRDAEDVVYTFDLALAGRIALVPEPLAGYRVHRSSQSRSQAAPEILWQRSFEEWASRRADQVPPATAREIRRGCVATVAAAARAAKWERRWSEYWMLRRHLAAYTEWPDAAGVVNERILPRWAYWAHDRMAALWARRRAGRRSEPGVF